MSEEKKKVNLSKKSEISINLFLDISDPENPIVLSKEQEPKSGEPLPPTIFEIKSKWSKVTWTLENLISLNSYSDKVVNGKVQRIWDITQMVISRIRCLLKSCNLNELDESCELKFMDSIDVRGVKILTDETMIKLGDCDPAIINALYNRAVEKLFPQETLAIKNLLMEEKK